LNDTYFLLLGIKDRSEVVATDKDVELALSTVDSDNDDRINLAEFFRLLSLFFSSKNNVTQRIESVLKSESSCHEVAGSLNSKEAAEFQKFLTSFYGQAREEEVDKETSYFANLIGEMVKRLSKNTNQNEEAKNSSVEYKAVSSEAAAQLSEFLFVKFRDQVEQVEETEAVLEAKQNKDVESAVLAVVLQNLESLPSNEIPAENKD
jgi:hypothetical protein